MNKSGIYIIKNTINGKSYIGSAVNLKSRESKHKSDLSKNKHHSIKLQRSWNKYGKQNFIFDILEIVLNKNDLIEKEQFWIDLYGSYKNGFNCCGIAGSILGIKRSEETRAKMSNANKLRAPVSDETRKKMSEIMLNISVETRAKMSSAAKSRPLISESTRKKLSDSVKNMVFTDEIRSKISNGLKGKTKSDEHKAKLSASAKLRASVSNETRKKISEAGKGRIFSDEHKARLSASVKLGKQKALVADCLQDSLRIL